MRGGSRIVPRDRRARRDTGTGAHERRRPEGADASARVDRDPAGGASERVSGGPHGDQRRRRDSRCPHQRRRVLDPSARCRRRRSRAGEIRSLNHRTRTHGNADAVVRVAILRDGARRSGGVPLEPQRCEMTRGPVGRVSHAGQVGQVGQVGQTCPPTCPPKRWTRRRKREARRWVAVCAATVVLLFAIVPLLAQDGDWLMYSGSYSSDRFSPLKQITPDNVKKLRAVWVYQPPGTGSLETTPLVVNLGFPRVNRGVAIVDNTVYVGTLDGYLVALDAKAGIERWSVQVGENPSGHAITPAHLAVDGKIIV